jgi:hypothetical protein
MLRSAVDLVVHLERRQGRRRVAAIAEVAASGLESRWP